MSSRATAQVFTALIRTHHISSRKKLQRVKKAASQYAVPYVLIRSGAPGIMYAEGNEESVTAWVSFVRGLRYKDFQCPRKPALNQIHMQPQINESSFQEVTSIAEFGDRIEQKGLTSWWKAAMGYTSSG
ncbi:hypothetical protein F5Y18DRAFT_430186 [Xylariaceae sp. FL1019]|nr:hypothetical protein F5Y18DRAFT_430186 [Xylariaceae sp. FL1019]